MARPENWPDMPVWKCTRDDLCDEQWATWNQAPLCHTCDQPAEPAGFTWGEAEDVAERFVCEIPVYYPEPVPEVVQLSTLPGEAWVGMPVFHPYRHGEDQPDWFYYDVGVVVEVLPDSDFPELLRCRFIHGLIGASGSLSYSPENLWVPKVLADRLA